MARDRRVEYPGALYHVMARGNRREPIVLDDEDRINFERTLMEAVGMYEFELIAYTLMGNHYHLLLGTPLGNLVAGMQWFQATWTKRFNARHRQWGRLFGDRYKAKPVEEGEYLGSLLDYIHLNPVRAGLVSRRDGIEAYRWSSLADYVAPKRKRRKWITVSVGLEAKGYRDDSGGRRRYIEDLEHSFDWSEYKVAGLELPDGQSLQSTLRRGWYFGSEAMREKLLSILEEQTKIGERDGMRRFATSFNGPQTIVEKESAATRIVEAAQRVFGLSRSHWEELPKGDWRKGLAALLVRQRNLASNSWLSARLSMGAPSAVSRSIANSRRATKNDTEIRQAFKKLQDECLNV